MDPATGEVIPFAGPTVPLAAYREIEYRVHELEQHLEAEKRDRLSAHARVRAKQREIDDLMEDAADREVVLKVLHWWVTRTGRDEIRTKIPLSGQRAKIVRWLLRFWNEREVCIAMVGMLADSWYVEKGLTDWKYLAMTKGKWDEAKVEGFLMAGYVALGQVPPAVEPGDVQPQGQM